MLDEVVQEEPSLNDKLEASAKYFNFDKLEPWRGPFTSEDKRKLREEDDLLIGGVE